MRFQRRAGLPTPKPAEFIIYYFARKRKRKRENSLKIFVMSSCYVPCIMLTYGTPQCVLQTRHRILCCFGL